MTTIHDVAARAGVSIATVSNVINHTRKVSPNTEARVKDALKELNYVPNIVARSLKTNTYKSIGIIAEEVTAFSTPPIIDAICAFFDSKDYMVNLCDLRTYSHPEYDTALLQSSLNTLEASRAGGIIYIGSNLSNVEHIRHLITRPTIFAYCTASPKDCCITYDNFQAAKQAAKLLISRGHKHIGIITGSLDQAFVHQRIMGFRSEMVEAQLTLPASCILTGNWSYDLACEQAEKLLTQKNPPTAIFAMNDVMAYAVAAVAHRRNLRIPEDLSVIGFDNRSHSAYSLPAITTLDIPLYDIGHLAARMLLQLLETGEVPSSQLLHCTLIERNSVGEAPARII